MPDNMVSSNAITSVGPEPFVDAVDKADVGYVASTNELKHSEETAGFRANFVDQGNYRVMPDTTVSSKVITYLYTT